MLALGSRRIREYFSAENELQQKKIIDARPSDCLPMAAQQCAPIYVSLDVWLHETDVSSPRGRGVDPPITASFHQSSVWHAASCLFGFGHSDLLRLHRRRRWIGGLELAELLFFLLGLLFNVSFPLSELIVWFCQFVILLQG